MREENACKRRPTLFYVPGACTNPCAFAVSLDLRIFSKNENILSQEYLLINVIVKKSRRFWEAFQFVTSLLEELMPHRAQATCYNGCTTPLYPVLF
jgi:hypothetical protein